jgi:hypothetical protein
MRVSPAYRERLIREWQEAYEIANDKTAPAVTVDRGWFLIGTKRYGRKVFEEMRNNLRFAAHARPMRSVPPQPCRDEAEGHSQ